MSSTVVNLVLYAHDDAWISVLLLTQQYRWGQMESNMGPNLPHRRFNWGALFYKTVAVTLFVSDHV